MLSLQHGNATISTGADPGASPQAGVYVNTGAYGQSQDDHAVLAAAAAASVMTQNNVTGNDFVNAGAFNFNKRAVRVGAGAVRADDAVDDYGTRGRPLQLANAFGCPSNFVFFEPNDFKLTRNRSDNNPLIVYCVLEVYDDVFLEEASRSYARGQANHRLHAGQSDYRNSHRRAIEELEFVLSKKNYKNGQILAAWVPSAICFAQTGKSKICRCKK